MAKGELVTQFISNSPYFPTTKVLLAVNVISSAKTPTTAQTAVSTTDPFCIDVVMATELLGSSVGGARMLFTFSATVVFPGVKAAKTG